GRRLFRLLVSLLLFLVVVNLIDLLPIPVMHAATADPNVTIGLALMVFVLIHFYGFVYRGIGGHLASFTKPFWMLTPINVMEAFTNPTTLAMRLFGNIFAGDLLMEIATSIAPKAITVAGGFFFIASVVVQLGVLGFNTFINLVQAYIFMMLTLAYVGMSMRSADEH
ncbi:MAG TPA: F0F1 ATP synthase subunit A, partial [Limnochordia bacterium]|nr:F0F1 ATP synthase subunit A [Limnochordia bacterium]